MTATRNFKSFLVTSERIVTHHVILAMVDELVGGEQCIFFFADKYVPHNMIQGVTYLVPDGAVRLVKVGDMADGDGEGNLFTFEQVDVPEYDEELVSEWIAQHGDWEPPTFVDGTYDLSEQEFVFAVAETEDTVLRLRSAGFFVLVTTPGTGRHDAFPLEAGEYVVVEGHKMFKLLPDADAPPVEVTEAELARATYARWPAERFWAKAKVMA